MEVIEMQVEEQESQPLILLYSWKLIGSKASRDEIIEELRECAMDRVDLVLQSSRHFLSKQEASQDAKREGSLLDCTHLVLCCHRVQAPSLFDILSYLVAEELKAIILKLTGSSGLTNESVATAWQELDANSPDNLFDWMIAVMSRIPLASAVKQLYLIDACLPSNVYMYIIHSYTAMKEMTGILDIVAPDYLADLIQQERTHLNKSGQWPFFEPVNKLAG